MSDKKLTPKQRKRFETLVEEGRNCYSAMALILKEVRDDRLYRETHDSFKAFAKSQFKIGERRAYQLIEHVEIVEEMEKQDCTMVQSNPLNERQTRELAKVDPEQRAEVFGAAVEESKETGKPITAAVIRKQAAKVELLEPEVEGDEEYEEVGDTPEWEANKPDVDSLRRQVNELTKAIKDAPDAAGFEMVNGLSNRIQVDLSNVKAAIVGCVPYKTCPYCLGADSECEGCSGRGWVNRPDFNNAPKEMQDEVEKISSGGRK